MLGDLRRIMNLGPRAHGDAEALTTRFKTQEGTWTLNQDQADALQTLLTDRLLLAVIDVGGGKTLTGMLACRALGIAPEDALVIVPAKLRNEAHREWRTYREHFDVPEPGRELTYMSYAQLSRPEQVEMLMERAPKLMVFDEVSKLKSRDSARTRRITRYLKANPETVCVGMDATIMDGSLHDWWHIARLFLRDKSPLPESFARVTRWARVVDAQNREFPTSADYPDLMRLADFYDIPEQESLKHRARLALGARLTNCAGMIFSSSGSCDVPLRFEKWAPAVPPAIRDALAHLDETWELPNGDFVEDVLRKAAAERQLALGFYYKWVWEGDEDRPLLYRRRAFDSAVRSILKLRLPAVDSPRLVLDALDSFRRARLDKASACVRIELPLCHGAAAPGVAQGRDEGVRCAPVPRVYAEVDEARLWNTANRLMAWEDLSEAEEQWQEVKDKPWPETHPEWFDETLIRQAVEQHAEDGTLIWYNHLAVAHKLRELGVPTFLASEGTRPEDEPVAALSVRAHGVGLNLQRWNRNLVLAAISSGDAMQQLIGRTHRSNQDADEVLVKLLHHTAAYQKAAKTAAEKARSFETQTQVPQKFSKFC